MTPLERVRDALRAAGCTSRNDRDWTCPAHEDSSPSLSLGKGTDDQALLKCHAGCDFEAILGKLGMVPGDLYPAAPQDDEWTPWGVPIATYRYVDKAGTLVMGVCRFPGKQFRQWRPDPAKRGGRAWSLGDAKRKLVPYRLPEILAAAEDGRPVFVAEGEKDADAIVAAGGAATCNPMGAGKWRGAYARWFEGADVLVVADRDQAGRAHAAAVATSLAKVAASVRIVEAVEGKDAYDHLAAGYSLDDLTPPAWVEGQVTASGLVEGDVEASGVIEGTASMGGSDNAGTGAEQAKRTLGDVEAAFRAHHEHGDLVALRATLAAYAANRCLPGDPVWLGLVSGSSTGKTETALALADCPGVLVKSTISGEAALLSGVAAKDRAADATGGILRQVGDRGVLVVKDFTTILSMHPDKRGQILSALREVYDGSWSRDVGTEGGHTLRWPEQGRGKLGLVMCSTTAYDRAYSVIALMGDRFLLVRLDDDEREAGAVAALHASAGEDAVRDAIAAAAAGLLGDEPDRPPLDGADEDLNLLAKLADFVTMARSPVDRDHQGEIALVLDPEGPYRFVKQLYALWRACGLLGLNRDQAWEVAFRVARDSLPRLRWRAIRALADAGEQSTNAVARAAHHPTRTTRRALEDLTAHGVVERRTLQLVGAAAEDRWRLADQYRESANALVAARASIIGPPVVQAHASVAAAVAAEAHASVAEGNGVANPATIRVVARVPQAHAAGESGTAASASGELFDPGPPQDDKRLWR
jgi:hypothetical protein